MNELDEWMEERRKTKIANGLQNGEFYQENIIICPYCGKTSDYWWEDIPKSDDEFEKKTCPVCEESFFVKWERVYTTKKRLR
jgi:hypothetical protein